MGRFVHDKIPSDSRPREINTLRVAIVLLAGVLLCASFGTSEPVAIRLTSFPESAVNGAEVTLSCAATRSGGVIGVSWYRNNVEIFYTGVGADSKSILNPATASNESRAVAGRVTVSSSLQQHNIALRINATLDQGSVWKCHTGNVFSNNVMIDLVQDMWGDVVTTDSPTTSEVSVLSGTNHVITYPAMVLMGVVVQFTLRG